MVHHKERVSSERHSPAVVLDDSLSDQAAGGITQVLAPLVLLVT
jgi:hypothetical protein